MGIAIGWFACHGFTVCVPLTDSQPYDLVVDGGEGLKRVAVRTTTQKRGQTYLVGLRTQGGNKSQFTITTEFSARAHLALGRKCEPFKL